MIIDDNQLGESHEVFAVLFGLPQDAPCIRIGSVRVATMKVSDTPGRIYQCVCMCVCVCVCEWIIISAVCKCTDFYRLTYSCSVPTNKTRLNTLGR